MCAFDDRLWEELGNHYGNSKGKTDLRRFWSACQTYQDSKVGLFPNGAIAKQWTKVFMGLRRCLLRQDWTYLSAGRFHLYGINAADQQTGYRYRFFSLPVQVGGPNEPIPDFVWKGDMPDEVIDTLEVFDCRYRDFAYGIKHKDDNYLVMGLKYLRESFNMLILYAKVWSTQRD
jgi:hypothetical protein